MSSGDVNHNVNITFSGRDNASSAMRSISSSASRTTRVMGILGKTLKVVAAAAAAALATAAGLAAYAIWNVTKAALADRVAMAKLAFTQEKAQDATKAQTEATAELIDKLQLQTTISDDELRPAMSALALTGMSVKESQDLLSVAMDVAVSKGKSVQSVAEALSKAYNGNISGLSRLGIKTTDASGDALKFSEILETLKERTEGAAKAAGKTDPIARLQAAWEQTTEALGEGFLPIVRIVARFVINKFVPWVKDKLVPAVKLFTDWIRKEAVPWVREHLMPVWQNFVKWLRKEAIPWIGTKLREALDKVTNWWNTGGKEAVEGLWKQAQDAWKNVKELAKQVFDLAVNLSGGKNGEPVNEGLDGVATSAGTVAAEFSTAAEALTDFIEQLNWLLEKIQMIDELRDSLNRLGLAVATMGFSEVYRATQSDGSADGGYLKRRGMGGWTMVGEHGPELINNRGYVKTHSQTMGMQGGGNVIHIHGAIDPVNTARQIERILAKGGRVSGGVGLATA